MYQLILSKDQGTKKYEFVTLVETNVKYLQEDLLYEQEALPCRWIHHLKPVESVTGEDWREKSSKNCRKFLIQ